MTSIAAEATFSETLRKATGHAHAGAQGSQFVRDLFAGKLTRVQYASMVAQHYFIYEALEATAHLMATDPVAAPFVSEELTRLPALEADLTYLLGATWRGRIAPTDATTAYCQRITATAGDSPAFVAHHYVRYLGDLSGGQHIAKFISKVFEFNEDGVRFYDFAGIADADAFKNRYRRNLDLAPWSTAERERLIAEALVAYEVNTRVLVEL